MLPKWNGAPAVYSKAYAMLDRMGRGGHVKRVRHRGWSECIVSDEMREFIEALNQGIEESVKGLLMVYADRGY